ncbi:HAD-IA family hydrolase [Candidatus Woesearchaeota archaeon]|nr:HAD-IA family hydrolase [Candidatus Woesearchaeota archaeon]
MVYSFTAKGHRNILANHKNTLEFTKDGEMTPDGDCIVGVGADFSAKDLKKLALNHGRLRMRIIAGSVTEEIDFTANKAFSSESELVIRFSEFSSDRTLGFRATKSAKQLDRRLVKLLRDPDQKIKVEIFPVIKAVIFDFDDTIEDFKAAKVFTHRKIAEKLLGARGVYEPTTISLLQEIDRKFSMRGVGSEPRMYDRHLWFEEYFKTLGLDAANQEIDELVTLYWRYIIESAKEMPHAAEVLKSLKENYKIAVMSDSDGSKALKMERLKTVGLHDLIDLLLTSDEVGVNKPDRRFYSIIFEKFGVKAEECVMVGDKPQVDLKLAKELGMATVWMRHGDWAGRESNSTFDYVDHSITDLRQIIDIMKEV